MPNNHKTKRCRGRKFKLKANGIKVNFKKQLSEMRDLWNRVQNNYCEDAKQS